MFKVKPLLQQLAGAALLAVTAASAASAQVTWDMPTIYPSGNMHVVGFEEFAKRVDEATGGAVKINVHPGGALGFKGPEMIAAVRDGLVPIGDVTPQLAISDLPIAGFAALPGLTSGYADTKTLLDIARPYYEAGLAENNQKLLYVTVWPGQGVYTQEPFATKADLENVKIRTSDKNSTNFFAALGAQPINMPWGEVVPSLSSGAINAVTTSSQSGVDGKFWEFLKYLNKISWANPLETVVVNLDAWNALSEENQKAIEGIAKEMEPGFWAKSEALDSDLTKQLEENGIVVSYPTDALKKELAAAAEPTWLAWAEGAGPDAAKILSEARAALGR